MTDHLIYDPDSNHWVEPTVLGRNPDPLTLCNGCDAAPAAPDSPAGYCERCEADAILGESGLPPELIATMRANRRTASPRCYEHPESPTGYVGSGKPCVHRPAFIPAV
jgi:hypothetical protein